VLTVTGPDGRDDRLNRLRPLAVQKYETLAKRYDWLWDHIMAGRPDVPTKALLRVFEGDTDSGYRSEHNELHVVLGGHDLDDVPDPADVEVRPASPPHLGWPIWERELHHEFVHEYQDKVGKGKVSDEGRELDADPNIRRFDGKGHDVTYYTSAAEVARALGIDVQSFVNAL
jgi:hypothetical protein